MPISGPAPIPFLSDQQVLFLVLQVAVLLLAAHTLGEVTRKLGQPPVVGQLLAGIVLGRSALGAAWPQAHGLIFPPGQMQGHLLQVVSWIGVLFLLTLTGLETDAELVRRQGRAALWASVLGIFVPFAAGVAVGWCAPATLLAAPHQRLAFSLFVGTALLISSVPVVARILGEMRLLRRDVGQIILATAIVSDSVGWIIVSLAAPLAEGRAAGPWDLVRLVLGTCLYLGLLLALGRRVILALLRWIHATVRAEEVLLGAVVILILLSAGITQILGAHAVLGAFVIGVVLRQSPMLGELVTSRFEGLTLGVFAPIFFAAAGIYVNLDALRSLPMLAVTGTAIFVASATKLVGCYLGGRLGGLGRWEALSLGIGSNARGAIGLILAIVGLSVGVLTPAMYSVFVVTAVFTTVVTPPLLRYALAHVSVSSGEEARLTQERIQAASFFGSLRRILLPARGGRDALAAARLLRYLGAGRKLAVSPMWIERSPTATAGASTGVGMPPELARALDRALGARDADGRPVEDAGVEVRPVTVRSDDVASAIVERAVSGYYGLVALGCGHERPTGSMMFGRVVDDVIRRAPCSVLVMRAPDGEPVADLPTGAILSDGSPPGDGAPPRRILVPATGATHSRRAAEVAVLVARATGATIRVLHIVETVPEGSVWNSDLVQVSRSAGRDLVEEVAMLAEAFGIPLEARVREAAAAGPALVAEAREMEADLVVLGALRRSASRLFLGPTIACVLENLPCALSVLIS